MARAWIWIRYGIGTCLGLALIGLAAVSPPALDPEATEPRGDEDVAPG